MIKHSGKESKNAEKPIGKNVVVQMSRVWLSSKKSGKPLVETRGKH